MASIVKGKISNIKEIVVNEKGDTIKINTADATFKKRFAEFLDGMAKKTSDMEKKALALEAKYEGKEIFEEKENGLYSVDMEQITAITNAEIELYKGLMEELDDMFGQDIIKKYFADEYEINPEFVPDADSIVALIADLTQEVEVLYEERNKSVKSKYSTSRKGQK